jgi:GT2 family glycosyltransferase
LDKTITKPILSIIIVNYNGAKFLYNCINSITKSVDFNHEIILVDNNSTDKSVSIVRKHFKNVRIIENKKNLGFATGNNIGISESSGEYILLLNNDTILLTPLSHIINKLKKNQSIGVIGGLLRYENGQIQPSIGYEHTPLRIIFFWLNIFNIKSIPTIFKKNEYDLKKYNKDRRVDWVLGAFLVTRRSIWDKLNGMDEKYFMYVEDSDYCKRVRKNGYHILFSPKFEVIHFDKGGQVFNPKALEYTIESYFIYLSKFNKANTIYIVRYCIGFIFIFRAFIYAIISIFLKTKLNLEKSRTYLTLSKRLIINKSLK